MLQQAQIDCYHEQGWLGVEDVLSREDVESLRRVTQEFVEKSRNVTVSDNVFDLEPGHSAAEPRLRRLKEPISAHPLYDQIMRNEKHHRHRVAADRAEYPTEWHQAEHEVARIRQSGGMASGLGLLSAHQ